MSTEQDAHTAVETTTAPKSGGGADTDGDGDDATTTNIGMLPFNEDEIAVFNQLRARLEDMKGDSIAGPFLDNDSVMWRYFTANSDGKCPGPEEKIEATLDLAEKQFRESIAWRHEVDINGMWARWRTHTDISQRDPFVQLGSYAYYGQGHIPDYTRNVTSGGPVVYERPGAADFRGIVADEDVVASVKEAYTMVMESLWRKNLECGPRARATLVMDLKGLGWSFFSNMALIREMSRIGPPNFPELTEKILVVRAPWFVKAAYKLIGPLLPKRTREKVKVCNNNWPDKLRALLKGGDSSMPDFLGGEKSEGEHMICPALPVTEIRELVKLPEVQAGGNHNADDSNNAADAGSGNHEDADRDKAEK